MLVLKHDKPDHCSNSIGRESGPWFCVDESFLQFGAFGAYLDDTRDSIGKRDGEGQNACYDNQGGKGYVTKFAGFAVEVYKRRANQKELHIICQIPNPSNTLIILAPGHNVVYIQEIGPPVPRAVQPHIILHRNPISPWADVGVHEHWEQSHEEQDGEEADVPVQVEQQEVCLALSGVHFDSKEVECKQAWKEEESVNWECSIHDDRDEGSFEQVDEEEQVMGSWHEAACVGVADHN